ncbi:uncharacterized protein [Primulina huaijiensis]|uniref:uncharacterized protein n=1 Tax=Primulina huaijiensis TaxID=1492673 RepID=UPI003CC724ED
MVKWTVELGEYDIEYKPRAAIKAQALTDFLIEMIQPVEEEVWRVFVDGASNLSGCGVGLVLIAPSEEKIKLALIIVSRITNNEAEYEAVLAGLQAVREVVYEAKNEKMLKYLGLINARAASLIDWSIDQIPREENAEADTLAKLAASMSDISTREVLCFTQLVLSIDEEEPSVQNNSWMTPIVEYIMYEKLPEDRVQAAKIRKQAPRFVFLNNVLYMRSYQGPLLKCLSEGEVEYVLCEIHEGCCGEHLGGTALSRKTILAGFWWPRMNQDAARLVQKCQGCQHHSNFHYRPAANNGRQFQGKKITSWCRKMKITQSFTSVAYPQANGQTEVINRIIVQALKARLHGKGKDWVEELPSILWAYRTTPRSSTQETPYSLVYGSEAVLPVEIGQSSIRIESYPSNNDQSRSIELDLEEEKRDRAAIRMEAYRSRVMKSYNKHVRPRNFQVGDLVMKKTKPVGDVGKLEARWERPFKVIQKVSSGAAYYLEDPQGHFLKRPWNAFHLKKYYV